MGKVDDYIDAAKTAAKAKGVPALNARYDGVKAQFEELGMALVEAEATGDTSAEVKYKKVLEENLAVREKVVADLIAAGEAVTDEFVK